MKGGSKNQHETKKKQPNMLISMHHLHLSVCVLDSISMGPLKILNPIFIHLSSLCYIHIYVYNELKMFYSEDRREYFSTWNENLGDYLNWSNIELRLSNFF